MTAALTLASTLLLNTYTNNARRTASSSTTDSAISRSTIRVNVLRVLRRRSLSTTHAKFLRILRRTKCIRNSGLIMSCRGTRNSRTGLRDVTRHLTNGGSLVLSVSAPTSRTVTGTRGRGTILFATMASPVSTKLITDTRRPKTGVAKADSRTPVSGRVRLLLSVMPATRAMKVVFGSDRVGSIIRDRRTGTLLRTTNIGIRVVAIASAGSIRRIVRSLMRGISTVCVPASGALSDAVTAINRVTVRTGVPIVPNTASVIRINKLTACKVSFGRLKHRANRVTLRVLRRNGLPSRLPMRFPRALRLIVGRRVTRTLKVSPSDVGVPRWIVRWGQDYLAGI